MLFGNIKLELLMILFLLSITSYSYAQEFTIEKVADIYKADDYRKIVKDEDRLIASGTRALHLLTNDDEGYLIELDELPLWGELGVNQQSELILLGISGDYIFIIGTKWGSPLRRRLYKVLIENNTLTLLDSINFYDDECVDQILLINNHLFVMPHYFNNLPLYIYDINDLEIVAEYDYPAFFHDNNLYKLNEQYLYTWDDDNYYLMHIFDVSDVCNIQEIAEIDFNEIFPDLPKGLTKIIDDTTLCMCNPGQYSFFDISDISDWQLLGTIDYPDENALQNLAILNDDRIIIPLKNGCVGLYDVSNFEAPVQLSSYNYDSMYNMDGCVCFEDYFYRVDTGLGIHQFRIINDQFEYLDTFPEFKERRGVYMNDDLLAVRTRYWHGMHFYDISDLNNVHYICTHFDNYFQYGSDFEDNLFAVPLVSYPDYNQNIDIYDISDIENPELVNRIENIFATDVYLEYPYLYAHETVPGTYEYHFVKYNISEPFNPLVIYDFDLYFLTGGYFKYGNNVFYGGGEETINILGNLDGAYPEVVATLEIDGLLGFWPMDNGYFTAQKYNNFIKIYSLENPLEPELMFDYPFTFDNGSSGITEDLFFVGNYSINIFDIENGLNIDDPIYNLEMPFLTDLRFFLERDNEDYVLFTSYTGTSLYKYNYDNTFIFENEIHSNKINLSNYPNPFKPSGAGRNPATTISFNLTANDAKNAKVEIYNIKGQRVKTLECLNRVDTKATESLSHYSVTWDGRDENNKPVTSGVYLYKLKTGKQELTRKMLLLK